MNTKSDILTIGQYLCELYNINDSASYESVGQLFVDYVQDGTPHSIVKQLRFNQIPYAVLSFAKEIRAVHTNTITFDWGYAKMKVRLFRNYSGKPKGGIDTYILDFVQYSRTFLVIDSLESCKAGEGSRLLNNLLRYCDTENIPVVLKAGYLYYGDCATENRDQLDRLIAFYKKHGFIDVNSVVGCNSESVVMVNTSGNDKLKKLLVSACEEDVK